MRRRLVWVLSTVVLVMSGPTLVGDAAAGVAGGAPEVGTADWRTVAAGGEYTCGIRTTGRLYCWGSDDYLQLGNGATTGDQPAPSEVAGNHTDWASVTAGLYHACGRRSNGRLYCWGYDEYGQLGNGATTGNQAAPTQVAGNHTDWKAVEAGGYHTCGRRSNGRLYCWGYDGEGQSGNGATTGNQAAPTQVAGNHTDWKAITAGDRHTCGRRSNGRLYCWGDDTYGRLGNGATTGNQAAPTQVAGNHTDWRGISAGLWHTCGRRSDGRLYCWGHDGGGKLGNGAPTGNQAGPTQVAGNHTDWTAVTAGGQHTCGRRSNGRLYCWGIGQRGTLGNGTSALEQDAPDEVAGNHTDWTAVTGGEQHTCGRRSNSRLYCWGDDLRGQLGNGGAISGDQLSPVEVAP